MAKFDDFNWSFNDEILRHLTDFVILNDRGECEALHAKPQSAFTAQGNLLERPSYRSRNRKVGIEFDIDSISIFYGANKCSSDRGLWLIEKTQKGSIYYKLEQPHESFAEYARDMQYRVLNFFRFYDAICESDNGTGAVLVPGNAGTYKCIRSVQEIHQMAGTFDLDFIAQEHTYVLDHLGGFIDMSLSRKFCKSIRKLRDKLVVSVESPKSQGLSSLDPSILISDRNGSKRKRCNVEAAAQANDEITAPTIEVGAKGVDTDHSDFGPHHDDKADELPENIVHPKGRTKQETAAACAAANALWASINLRDPTVLRRTSSQLNPSTVDEVGPNPVARGIEEVSSGPGQPSTRRGDRAIRVIKWRDLIGSLCTVHSFKSSEPVRPEIEPG